MVFMPSITGYYTKQLSREFRRRLRDRACARVSTGIWRSVLRRPSPPPPSSPDCSNRIPTSSRARRLCASPLAGAQIWSFCFRLTAARHVAKPNHFTAMIEAIVGIRAIACGRPHMRAYRSARSSVCALSGHPLRVVREGPPDASGQILAESGSRRSRDRCLERRSTRLRHWQCQPCDRVISDAGQNPH